MRWAFPPVTLLLIASVATSQTARRSDPPKPDDAAALPPSSQPATEPSSAPVQLSVSDASAFIKDAEHDALNRFRGTPRYKQLKSAADALENKLKEARLHGTAQQGLDASHDFVAADQNLKYTEAMAIAADPQVIEAYKILDGARRIEQQKRDQQTQARKVLEQGQILKGMTEEEAELAFAYRKKRYLAEGPEMYGSLVLLSNGNILDLKAGNIDPAENHHGVFQGTVIKKTVNDTANGVREIIVVRCLRIQTNRRMLNDTEDVATDKMGVSLVDGKVIEIFGQ